MQPRGSSNDDEKALYFDRYEQSLLPIRRRGLAICAIFFGLTGIVDVFIGGIDPIARHILRAVTFLIGVVFWYRFCVVKTAPERARYLVLFGVTGLLGQIAMCTVATGDTLTFYHYCIGLMMCFGAVVLVPRFKDVQIIFLMIMLGYGIAIFFMDDEPSALLIKAAFVVLTAVSVLFGSYQRERASDMQAIAEIDLKKAMNETDLARREAIIARDAALNANEAKSNFLACMSHELRTPMNAIIGFSDMIRSEIFGPIKPVEYADYAEHILHSGKLMQTHIDDLLDHARLESGKMSWTDEDFSLNDVIDSWLATCESAASDRGVNLTCADPLPDVTINGDPARIEQVVINLMNNAIKFTPPGGAVSVGATLAPGGALQITVTDNGCGISDQDLQRIKQPFVQLDDREYVTGKGGLGLGLAIVSGILAMMEGRLELTSEEGVGTVAMVEIPAKRIEGVSRAA